MQARPDRAGVRTAVSRKVRWRTALFALVFLVMAVQVIARVVTGGLAGGRVLAAALAGLAIGVLLARTQPLSLDTAGVVVVSRLTLLGGIVLALYLLSFLGRDHVLRALIHDNRIESIAGLALTGGVMLGRLAVQLRQIRRLLVGRGVLPAQPPAPEGDRGA